MKALVSRKIFNIILILSLVTGFFLTASPVQPAQAADFSVGTFAQLEAAINTANLNGEHDTITLTADISLTGVLPPISSTMTIIGDGFALNGADTYQIFSITSSGGLTLTQVTLANGFDALWGAAVYNEGMLTAIDSTFADNQAQFGGAILNSGILMLIDSTFADNQAEFGGGIFSYGGIIVVNSMFSGNSASVSNGGGIYNTGGTLTITDSTFTGNQTVADGGGVYNENPGLQTEIINTDFNENQADRGGGILSSDGTMTIESSTFYSNTAVTDGGGVFWSSGDITITDSNFLDNSSDGRGGGLFAFSGDSSITVSTFSGNTALNFGGALQNSTGSAMTLSNSTLTGSAADQGGAIYNRGALTLIHTTVANNTAVTTAGGIYNNAAGTLNLGYSIVADTPTGVDCYNAGTFIDGGYNLIENNAAPIRNCGTPLVSADPNLDMLADNGGSTLTLALLEPSPAIDAIPELDCILAVDQRGVSRPQSVECDLGAYESIPVAEIYKSVDDAAPAPGQTITFTIQVDAVMTITNGIISDTLPAGLNYLGPITLDPPGAGIVGGAPPTLVTNLVIAPGDSVQVTFPVTVTQGLTGGLVLTNTAYIFDPSMLVPRMAVAAVTVLNLPPVAVDDAGPGFLTDEKSAITTTNVLDNDTDPNGDLLIVSSYDDSGLLGSLLSNGDGTFVYDPNGQFDWLAAGEQDTDSFTYAASDGVLTDTATVTLVITGVNDAPIAVDDAGVAYTTHKANAFTTGNVLDNDVDPDLSDTLSVASFDDGSLLGLLSSNGDGTFAYDPNGQFDDLLPDEQALDIFTYMVTDGVLTDTAVVTITVTGTNLIPVVDAGEDQSADEGAMVQFSGSFSNTDVLAAPLEGEMIHWDFGDGFTITGTLTPTHAYADDGVYTATLTVTDTIGYVGRDWLFVTVDNISPILGVFPDQEAYAGEVITVTGVITDPGWLDTQIVVIAWGDGLTTTLNLTATEREFAATHTYTDPGDYPVSVVVTDKDGGSDEADFNIVVLTCWFFPLLVK